jgi:hypothetical protein
MVTLKRLQSLMAVMEENRGFDRVKRRKSVQNTNIPKHASCLQQDTKVKLQKMLQRNLLYVLKTK